MKSFYPIFFFVVLSINTFAQNWSPIIEGDVYHYELVGDTMTYDSIVYDNGYNNNLNVFKDNSPVAATLWIDSTSVDSSTVLKISHLNKIVKRCDTCSAISNYFPYVYLQNQPQFLGSDMMTSNNCEYIFTHHKELLLKPCALVGEIWIFEDSGGISAEVITIAEGEIFGNIDSLKHIALSNGDTIILSKSHGIIEFPQLDDDTYYRLIGIQTRDLGFNIHDYQEFYDFNVGDVFQYDFHDGGKHGGYYGTAKIRVTGKEVFQDSIIYSINRTMYKADYDTDWQSYNSFVIGSSRTQTDYTYTFTKNDVINFYPNQLFDASESVCYRSDNIYKNHYWEKSYTGCHWGLDEMGLRHTLYYGQDENDKWTKFMCNCEHTSQNHFNPVTDSSDSLILAEGYWYHRTWKEDIGETLLYHALFESYYYRYLTGYVIDGDTTGTIKSDEVLLTSISNINEGENWQITLNPSPASNLLHFDIQSDKYLQNIQITIYDSIGKIFITQKIDVQQSGSIDVSNLPNGIYFISFQTLEGVISRKFVKSQ